MRGFFYDDRQLIIVFGGGQREGYQLKGYPIDSRKVRISTWDTGQKMSYGILFLRKHI